MKAMVKLTMRCRRSWLMRPTVYVAAWGFLVSPSIGNRIANTGLWLARWEYRAGERGRWRRLPMHVAITDDDDGTPAWSVVSGTAPNAFAQTE